MDPLLEQFLQEARESLAFIDQNIESIVDGDAEILNSLFRAVHTIKGGSGIVDFDSIKEIAHYAEDMLDMLRSNKISLKESMTEALYNAFDEIMNLVEAAEESGSVVEADEQILALIIEHLKKEMQQDGEEQGEWKIPFAPVENVSKVINIPLKTLRDVNSIKIAFENETIDADFCAKEKLYAVVFNIDESCMRDGKDPANALSKINEKVLLVASCVSEENAKSILSAIEDESGMLLKSCIATYVYATYDEISSALDEFIDELQLLPLDVVTLLSLDTGDKGHKIDSLKELSALATSDINTIKQEVSKSMALIGADTLQHAQLERFLDIAGFIDDADVYKLASFFNNIYKGEVYHYDASLNIVTSSVEEMPEVIDEKEQPQEEEIVQSIEQVQEQEEELTEEVATSTEHEIDENLKATITNMLSQQYNAAQYIKSDDDLQRVVSMMQIMKKFIPDMPESFASQDEVLHFIESKLEITPKPAQEESTDFFALSEESDASLSLSLDEDVSKSPIVTKDENKKITIGKTVHINQESIDTFMNIVGELLVAKNSLPYLADNVFSMSHTVIKREIMEKYTFINRLSEQLQDLIMEMRMLPISYVFDRYPKLVREMAKKLEKKVHLEMHGGETKLDKNMIEMLAEPMIHIMRNSLDHGIESTQVREQKGKNTTGTIRLDAYTESDKILITIQDDGAGIDVQRVVQKVLEKGLMRQEEIDALNEDEKAELILLPGLSTTDVVSEFSGRGVGMDAVKKSIESFGGTIHIKTEANQGTKITLSIPISLAVTSLLHVEMNGIHYGIPMDSVSETVKLERSEIEYLHNEPFVYIRGEVIPLLFIKSMLNEEQMQNKLLSIVVLNIKGNSLALVVNSFLGQLDVVQKPLVGIMESHPLFSATALLGNGQIIMLIDPIGLFGISQKLKQDIEVA